MQMWFRPRLGNDAGAAHAVPGMIVSSGSAVQSLHGVPRSAGKHGYGMSLFSATMFQHAPKSGGASAVPRARIERTIVDVCMVILRERGGKIGGGVGNMSIMKLIKGSRSAFTIIEVLVVLGIVAVGLSLLLPVLARARSSVDETRAVVRVRQIAMAHQRYADDHRGYVATVFQPVYRSKADQPEVIEDFSGGRIRGGWFSNDCWSWLAADPTLTREVLWAPGHPPHNESYGPVPIVSNYLMSSAFFARPEYWNPRTQIGPEQWGAQRINDVAFPSDKGMFLQVTTYSVPGFPTGHPACCYSNLPAAVVWCDLSAGTIAGTTLNVGAANPWHHLAERGSPAWAGGLPILHTLNGTAGRDRGGR